MKTFLIAGLGNIGREYDATRHNIGFDILDTLAIKHKVIFQTQRLADVGTFMLKGRKFVLIKPSTYMNLSGKAVSYWLQHENLPVENLLVIADDVALPAGAIRIRKKGGSGGHNGLQHIIETLETDVFTRLRFGIGNQYPKGMQVEYVLGKWFPEQINVVRDRLEIAGKAVEEFGLAGADRAMNTFNRLADPTEENNPDQTP